MKRIYLTMDDQLFSAIAAAAEKKGIPPSSLVVSNLEDLYRKDEAPELDALLTKLTEEAQKMPLNQPFLLRELPSFSKLIISCAEQAHISPSTVRARVAKSFNAAVRAGKIPSVERAVRPNGQLMNNAGVAMFVRKGEG